VPNHDKGAVGDEGIMAKIDIGGKEYETDEMSEEERKRLEDIVYCDRKLHELRRDVAAIQTARNAYAVNLRRMLDGKAETEKSDS
jgi:hypothetical protein